MSLACIFDLDGTLVDSAPGITSALSRAFAQCGRAVTPAELRTIIGPPIRVMARRIFPDMTDAECTAVETAYRPLYDEGAWRETSLFTGARETLEQLQRSGSRLFIATNKPMLPAKRILDHLELLSLFEAIATRDMITPPLPDKTAMVAHLMTTYALTPAATRMIGDTAEDAEAAAANGLGFIFMKHGYGLVADAAHACDHFGTLPAALSEAHYEAL